MSVLEVKGLCKTYPGFCLRDVSFALEPGRVMGFIGRNGAGKTTVLRSILRIVHAEAGEVRCFGMDMAEREREIKQRIGYAGGAADFYKRKKLADIISVTRRFYDNWDDGECRRYLEAFDLDTRKSPRELSAGMRVKFCLTLALSHHAELLILDEPTSGLDPVSREELLEIFTYLRDQGVAVLFSTHITSDLEKCADDIAYIAGGRLISAGTREAFLADNAALGGSLEEIMINCEKENFYEKLADKRA